MRCKVNNKITSLEVHSKIPKEEDMEAVEDTKAKEATEAEEGVKEHLAKDEDQPSVITVDNRVTSHETIWRLPIAIVKLPIILLKSAQYC